MAWRGSFEELEAYLRGFVNISGEPVPYDFGGVLLLWLALLDNLRANHIDADLGDVAGYLSPEQAAFLLRLAERVREAQGAEPGAAAAGGT
jgi:hypothetical protein